MKKKIIFGSLIAVGLLLLMPSIPALQQRTIEDKAYDDFVEELKDVDLDDIEVLDGIKRPLLRTLVLLFFNFQGLRFAFYLIMSFVFVEIVDDGGDIPSFQPKNPILFLLCVIRAGSLLVVSTFWAELWNHISDTLGWGWDIPHPF